MTEHTEQSPAQPGTTPTPIALEDVIEAVARGATRAWAAPDDVGGYALPMLPASVFIILNPNLNFIAGYDYDVSRNTWVPSRP